MTMQVLVTLYLSGAMEKLPEDNDGLFQGTGWRNIIKGELQNYPQFKIIDPYDLEGAVRADGSCDSVRIVEGDKMAIMESDIIILNTGCQGVGTPMETLFAWEQNKLIYEFGGSPNPWYEYHTHRRFNSLEDIINYLKHIK